MAANALRFGDLPRTTENLELADKWAADVGDKLVVQVTTDFGALELMQLVLCQHYDFLNGRYTRGYVMAGMAARMMTFLRLHILDERPAPPPRPLLGTESLRRLAWSVWFLDATLDGGNFGFSAIVDSALTIALPCDVRDFLLHSSAPPHHLLDGARDLSLPAHLIRAMAARQTLASLHSRISRDLIPTNEIRHAIRHAEQHANELLNLPPQLTYGPVQYIVHKDQLPCLVGLHVMRNTAKRHAANLHILNGEFVPHRQTLIDLSLCLSQIINDALTRSVPLDPQIAMHAYNGIEVLVFQPLKQETEHQPVTIDRASIDIALVPLLQCIRSLAASSALVALIHPEAVNRMILRGYVNGLDNDDILAILKRVHDCTSAEQEFDFEESFWRYQVAVTRRIGGANGTPNDVLLASPVSPSYPLSHFQDLFEGQKDVGNGENLDEGVFDDLQTLLLQNTNNTREQVADPTSAWMWTLPTAGT